jgi:hypothetical protein
MLNPLICRSTNVLVETTNPVQWFSREVLSRKPDYKLIMSPIPFAHPI